MATGSPWSVCARRCRRPDHGRRGSGGCGDRRIWRSAGRSAGERVGRLAADLREREIDVLLVTTPGQPALPHRFHRHHRAGLDRRGPGRAPSVLHRLSLRRPVGRAGAGRVFASRDRRGGSARGRRRRALPVREAGRQGHLRRALLLRARLPRRCAWLGIPAEFGARRAPGVRRREPHGQAAHAPARAGRSSIGRGSVGTRPLRRRRGASAGNQGRGRDRPHPRRGGTRRRGTAGRARSGCRGTHRAGGRDRA